MFGFGKKKKLEEEIASLKNMVEQISNEAITSSNIQPGSQLWEVFNGGNASAGVAVNKTTAMRVSAVYACVRIIACSLALMPIPVYQSGLIKKKGAPAISDLLNKAPCETFTSAVFWEYIFSSVLLIGDGLAWIKRASAYSPTPIGLVPLKADNVTIKPINGRLRYEFYDENLDLVVLDQDDVLHIPGFGFDGVRSMSVITWAAKQAIGTAIASEDYSGEFFANSARPDVVLETEAKNLTPEQAKLIQETWAKKYSGSGKRYLPAVMTGGLKVTPITMNAQDSQLLETRKFQVIDIARAFGVPPHMIGEVEKVSAWGTGVEQFTIGFMKFTLAPYMNRSEQEINRKLFVNGRNYAEFNAEGLLRGDSKTRSEFYQKALGGSASPGFMTQNEIRALENLPPIKDETADKLTTWTMGGSDEEPKTDQPESESGDDEIEA